MKKDKKNKRIYPSIEEYDIEDLKTPESWKRFGDYIARKKAWEENNSNKI